MRKILKIALILILVVVFGITGVILRVRTSYTDKILAQDQLKPAQAIVVLGASILPNGQPSDALADRLDTGIALYHKNLASILFLTGDDGRYKVNEIQVMRNYVLTHGVPQSSIMTDGQGYRTYESCSRAINVFNIKNAILVTQNFHLPRALYLCNKLGMDATGVSADKHTYVRIVYFTLRDWLASFEAWMDINLLKPSPPV